MSILLLLHLLTPLMFFAQLWSRCATLFSPWATPPVFGQSIWRIRCTIPCKHCAVIWEEFFVCMLFLWVRAWAKRVAMLWVSVSDIPARSFYSCHDSYSSPFHSCCSCMGAERWGGHVGVHSICLIVLNFLCCVHERMVSAIYACILFSTKHFPANLSTPLIVVFFMSVRTAC